MLFCRYALLAYPILAFGCSSTPTEDTSSIKGIMDKLNKGPASLTASLKKGLDASDPDWTQIQRQSKEYSGLAVALTRTEPTTGDNGSWTKLTRDYADTAVALEAAAGKKDRTEALAAHLRLTQSCAGCHKQHRP